MNKKDTIIVQGTAVTLFSQREDQYISLTDMAKFKNSEIPAVVISHWMSTVFSVNYMGENE
ncbi:KilA-N domain-containing protein [Viscerimonas tarda]